MRLIRGQLLGVSTRPPRTALGHAPCRALPLLAPRTPAPRLPVPFSAIGTAVKRGSRRKCDIAVRSSDEQVQLAETKRGAGQRTVRVHYYRRDRNYQGWGLHVAGDPTIETDWNKPLQPQYEAGAAWVHWDLSLQESGRHLELIVHKGEEKSVSCRVSEWQVFDNGAVWLLAGEGAAYQSPPNLDTIAAGDLAKSYAQWVSADLIVWREPVDDAMGKRRFALHWSATASLEVKADGVHGAEGSLQLSVDPASLPADTAKKFPHLSGCTVLRLPEGGAAQVQELMTCQLAVAVEDAGGKALDATGVQLAGVLDALYTYEGPLGCQIGANGVAMHVWAPTARRVQLLLYDGARSSCCGEVEMARGDKGVWSAEGPVDWVGKYYKYRVTVYCPWTQCVEVSEATDPYSRSLAADSARTHIADINDPALQPQGWATHTVPALERITDISLYELHVRDFSCHDESVPANLRGKYLAFAQRDSAGMRHLRELSEAGLTHVHLLPSYDYGSVPEREEEQLLPEGDLSSFAPDSEAQQAAVLAVADKDAYNWGYDPVHYGVPEGSYATNPDGTTRVLEYRTMVQSLHEAQLRVVCDVVYNHTFQSGPHAPYSVLDKIVPGYYHRREENGDICMSTCCNNTASEHAMCERLVVDDIVHWARDYKIMGFRFDIMGHLMCSTMDKIAASLRSLTREADGVDGGSIYIYGEAWDFGEVAFNQRGRNASQLNITGSGLGGFNDRLRDAAMGGGPFAPSKMQGVVTGLFTAPNAYTQGEMAARAQLELLLESSDLLRLGLAANLREYVLPTHRGQALRGAELMYYGTTPAAYAQQPHECVNYVSCHDNQTLFDQVMMKAPAGADVEQRARMCMLANALVALGQGLPFFHAADELLRSKSLDRDSYNSGDWFNRIDWTGRTNNFGVGLPVATKNDYNWPIMQPLLADVSMKPSPETMQLAKNHFIELLRIRYSTLLFRLPSASDVCAQLTFTNTGPEQVPGVTVMQVASSDVCGAGSVRDSSISRVLAVFNARDQTYIGVWPLDAGSLMLHPVQAGTCDEVTRATAIDVAQRVYRVPPRTVAVLVEPR